MGPWKGMNVFNNITFLCLCSAAVKKNAQLINAEVLCPSFQSLEN